MGDWPRLDSQDAALARKAMSMCIRAVSIISLALVTGTVCGATPPPAPPRAAVALPAAQAVQVRTVQGALVRPLVAPGRKATVLIFIARDCPISNTYAPVIQRLRADYALSPIAFYVVYVDGGSAQAVRAHAKAHGYASFALRDPKHRLVKLTGATVTPEAAVLGPQGRLLYEGRIDDRFPDFGTARDIADVHDLRRALDAIRAGRPVAVARTKAVGCYIPGT